MFSIQDAITIKADEEVTFIKYSSVDFNCKLESSPIAAWSRAPCVQYVNYPHTFTVLRR